MKIAGSGPGEACRHIEDPLALGKGSRLSVELPDREIGCW